MAMEYRHQWLWQARAGHSCLSASSGYLWYCHIQTATTDTTAAYVNHKTSTGAAKLLNHTTPINIKVEQEKGVCDKNEK